MHDLTHLKKNAIWTWSFGQHLLICLEMINVSLRLVFKPDLLLEQAFHRLSEKRIAVTKQLTRN